jgi:hypothetical protein
VGCLFHLGCGPANDSTWECGARVSCHHNLLITTPKPPLPQIQSLPTFPHIETPLCCRRCKLLASAAACRRLPFCHRRLGALPCSLHSFDFPCCRRCRCCGLSLQPLPLPSPAAAATADAFPLKASPHRSLRRRPGHRSDAIDAPPTP